MAFKEDLDLFFGTDDFAVQAVFTLSNLTKKTINVIFESPTQSIDIYDTEIEADAPFLRCKTSDISKVQINNLVKIENKNYKVKKISDDGTGISLIYLKT